jgi:hypothetical protein
LENPFFGALGKTSRAARRSPQVFYTTISHHCAPPVAPPRPGGGALARFN